MECVKRTAAAQRGHAPCPRLFSAVCAAILVASVLRVGSATAQAPSAPPNPLPPSAPPNDTAEGSATNVIDPKVVDHWVKELGAPTFQRREQAVGELLSIGAPALKQLQSVRDSKDSEVRRRGRAVYLQILRKDYQRRITIFETGKTDDAAITSWQEFSRRFGDGAEQRALFAAMLRSTPELMIQLEGETRQLKKAIDQWIEQVDRGGPVFGSPNLNVGNITALAFCSLLAENNHSRANIKVFSTATYNARIRSEILSGKHADVLKAVLEQLVEREDVEMAAALRCCLLFGLEKPGLAKATEILQAKQPQKSNVMVESMMVLGRFGGEQEEAVLQRMVPNATRYTIFSHQGRTIQTNLGDVALALLWTMHDIKPSEKGFSQGIENDVNVINPHLAGFSTEQERAEAVQTWNDFRRGQVEQGKPKAP